MKSELTTRSRRLTVSPGYMCIGTVDEVRPWKPKRVTVNSVDIVVFLSEDEFHAIENVCPHQRFSLFHQAVCDHHVVTCPMHGWSFDLRTGRGVTGNGNVRTFDVRLDDGKLYVQTPGETAFDSMKW